MGKHNSHQKGPQLHAEGQHGKRTHAAFIEGLHGRHGGSEESEGAPQEDSRATKKERGSDAVDGSSLKRRTRS